MRFEDAYGGGVEGRLPCDLQGDTDEPCIHSLVQGGNHGDYNDCTQYPLVRLQCGNILRQRFEFGISQFLGNFDHYAVRTVGAIASPEISEL